MNYRMRLITISCLIFIAVCFFDLFSIKAHADVGPKPSINVKVFNGPSDYYIALLKKSESTKTNSELHMDTVDYSSVCDYLENFCYDGWIHHTTPLGFEIDKSNSRNEHKYGYMVPDIVRVIIISSDGTVYISDSLDVREFNAYIYYDVATGTLTENLGVSRPVKRLMLLIICLLLTLGLEFIVFKLFKYPFTKRNILCFIIINVATNIPFTYALLAGLLDWANIIFMQLLLFLEVIITIVESVFYIFALKEKTGEKKKLKNFLYGVVANVFSAVMGDVFMLFYWYEINQGSGF